jgi:hypothetical protein
VPDSAERPTDYPRRIRVGTVTYRVSDTPEDWQHASDAVNKVGETDHMAGVIRLKPGMAPSVLRITLWHEVLHAIMWSVLGGPRWDHLGDDPDDREEYVVARLEHPTLAVLRDNPGLVAYLTRE